MSEIGICSWREFLKERKWEEELQQGEGDTVGGRVGGSSESSEAQDGQVEKIGT
jgi:hypothetical protein